MLRKNKFDFVVYGTGYKRLVALFFAFFICSLTGFINLYGIEKRNPFRVVVDPNLESPPGSKFLHFDDKKAIIVTSSDNRNLEKVKEYENLGTRLIYLEGKVFKKALDFDTLLKYYNIINFTLELTENIIKNIKEIEL